MNTQNSSHHTNRQQPPVDWEAVYHDTMPRIFNFFRYRHGDEALAEDLTATTFMQAWRSREQYRHDLSAFSTWLFSIARHLSTDYLRRRRDELSLETGMVASDGSSPEDVVQHHDDLRLLMQLLRDLNDREKELLSLKYGAGLTNRKIATITGLSESNVGSILHRVIQKLREQIGVES